MKFSFGNRDIWRNIKTVDIADEISKTLAASYNFDVE